MSAITVYLRDKEQAKVALNHAYKQAKPHLQGDKVLIARIMEETRRDNHNRHFHSLIGQISAHVGGDLADAEDAKRILISAFKIDTKDDPDLAQEWAKMGEIRIGRGLRGETVLLGIQSRHFTIKLARAFIEWLYALGVEMGVVFKVWGDDDAH